MTTPEHLETAQRLIGYIDASPSPYHAVSTSSALLSQAGFIQLDEGALWDAPTERGFVIRDGSLVAWAGPETPSRDFRLIGAHTDSPNLRVKPQPDTGRAGLRQLGVELYGGVLLNSWLDRDLGLSGRVVIRADPSRPRLVRIDRPLLRIPQLAIHLDRQITDKGLKLDKQLHLSPMWGVGQSTDGEFVDLLAQELAVDAAEVLAWEVMLHEVGPSTVLGIDDEFVSAPRIDNLASCWAASTALVEASELPSDRTAVICLFDHEEVGSVTAAGAGGSILPTLLERIMRTQGGSREDLQAALAASVCVSADGAHATHPNYPERHEPDHRVSINGGPVIKINANARYATAADRSVAFQLACDAAGVPTQRFVSRTDLPCGSTIGPVTAAQLGVATVDVGIAQLAMHSARETCGSHDPALLAQSLRAFLAFDAF